MDLTQKEATNTWDSIDDFIAVLEQMRAGKWQWYANSKCKYVELRVDMRDGGCLIKDRNGNRIDPKDLAWQVPNAPGKPTAANEPNEGENA